MNRAISPCTVALSLLLLAACGSGSSTTTPATTGSGGLSTSPTAAGALSDVQRAINEAAPGSIVTIGPGDYAGRLVVTRSVTIVGSGAATVLRGIQGVDAAVIEVHGAADVVVADLVVSGPHEGLRIRESARVRVENVVATDNGHDGIDVRQSSDVVVVACECTDNLSGGVRVRDGAFDVLIDGCLVARNLDPGVEIRDALSVTVQNSTVAANLDCGIRVRDAAAIDLTGNDIVDNVDYGVRIRATPLDPGIVRQQNTLTGNLEGDVRVES